MIFLKMSKKENDSEFNEIDSEIELSEEQQEEIKSEKCCYCYKNKHGTRCCGKNCNEWICNKCKSNDEMQLDDWLSTTKSCYKCSGTCCILCIQLCYECANNSDTAGYQVTICTSCEKLKNVGCSEHRWLVCEDHKTKKCGTCKTNENYCGKYGF
jgi:hypothetical protein